jgi:N-acetylglucosamine kinase-like BadF-type ATPase
MIIVADSGSTKTDWVLGDVSVGTKGINPVRDTKEEILRVISTELVPRLCLLFSNNGANLPIDEIYFYGAGCIDPYSQTVHDALQTHFPNTEIHVYSDMLGAARGLCENQEGIACILGTGSNSCLCQGGEIQQNISPLGYILGDEGSGAVLGRLFLSEMLKGDLKELWQRFQWNYHLETTDIINHVYRQPQPNRFLASIVPFIKDHSYNPKVKKLLVAEFTRFLQRNVVPYGRPDLPVNFAGGVAYNFQAEIALACRKCSLQMGKIIDRPGYNLWKYHRNVF